MFNITTQSFMLLCRFSFLNGSNNSFKSIRDSTEWFVPQFLLKMWNVFFFSSVGLVYWTASKIIAQKIRLNRMIHSKTPTSLSPAVTLNIFHVFSSLSWFKQFNQNMYHQTFTTKICCFSPCFAAHPGLITHQFQCNLKVRLLCIASVYYGLSGN